ncbi:membrane protein insertion efficiency factor YidD [Pseudobdellovibrio exovorus]|uniref:membrane protein insertion efficiency factor YidD n=1 Tax=Pseudobdellovibrio exovorus TaxID=453816 RepID=UPI0009FE0AB2
MLNFLHRRNTLTSKTSTKISNKVARFFILFYQATFSYFLGGNCRYYPSCSHYAHEAYTKHSVGYASWLVFKRLMSCHPFSKKSFYDPVPLTPAEIEMSLYEQSKRISVR